MTSTFKKRAMTAKHGGPEQRMVRRSCIAARSWQGRTKPLPGHWMLLAWLIPAWGANLSGQVEASPTGFTAALELVALDSPGATDTSIALPDSISAVSPGATFFLELWAQTSDLNGFAQVSADLAFDPAAMSVTSLTFSALFDLFPNGVIDNVSGLIDDLSGSHTPAIPPCSDQVGVSPNWARVAIIEMQAANAPMAANVQLAPANDGTHFVGTCGSAVEPAVAFGSLVLGVGTGIPTVSQWGLIVLSLMLVTTATLVLESKPVSLGRSGVARG